MCSSYLVTSPKGQLTLYYEPHCVYNENFLEKERADIVITPVIKQLLPNFTLVSGQEDAVRLAKLMSAKYVTLWVVNLSIEIWHYCRYNSFISGSSYIGLLSQWETGTLIARGFSLLLFSLKGLWNHSRYKSVHFVNRDVSWIKYQLVYSIWNFGWFWISGRVYSII